MGPVGVVGASARAAVLSLARAGLSAWAVDLFADRDLKRIAPCVRCPLDRYPDAIPELCDGFPPGPVLYTGGLENHPTIVRDLAHRRPLWGTGPETLERVRDPDFLARVFDTRPAAPGRVLWKSVRSTGGLGVRFAVPGEACPPGYYPQEFLDGPSLSAQFVSYAGYTQLLGVTEQLVGVSGLHARPFAYCGNIGPVSVPDELRGTLNQFGATLAHRGGLCGAWGVDFILHDGRPYPVDLNPRYTGGMEVIEAACSFSALAPAVPPQPAGKVVGKAIYYAPHRTTFPASGPWDADLAVVFDPWRLPAFADIPESGEVIEAGSPVLTVFTSSSSAEACRVQLQSRATELDTVFALPRREAERGR